MPDSRHIATRAEFDGAEGRIVADIDESGITITNRTHGDTFLPMADFDRIAEEVAAYRRAVMAASDVRLFPRVAHLPVTLHEAPKPAANEGAGE